MYTHGIASLAAVEAYGMTRSTRFEPMAQKCIDYIVKVQNPLGGWNYESPDARNDLSVSGWQGMALKSAKIAELKIPEDTIYRLIRYLEIACNEKTGSFAYAVNGTDPKANYEGGGGSIRMRAAGSLLTLFFAKDPTDPVLKMNGQEFAKNLPGAGPVDIYYWYYATLTNFQLGGDVWKAWNEAMKTTLLNSQCKATDGHADGSWAATGEFSNRWSRPGQTAVCVLCLEVYYRYMPLYMK
jgi:hypothetical protein